MVCRADVYACRITLQFFTIPVGLFLGGVMVDHVCEPAMGKYGERSILKALFGTGKISWNKKVPLLLLITAKVRELFPLKFSAAASMSSARRRCVCLGTARVV